MIFKSFYDWSISNGYKEGLSIDRIKQMETMNQIIVDGQHGKYNRIIEEIMFVLNIWEKNTHSKNYQRY